MTSCQTLMSNVLCWLTVISHFATKEEQQAANDQQCKFNFFPRKKRQSRGEKSKNLFLKSVKNVWIYSFFFYIFDCLLDLQRQKTSARISSLSFFFTAFNWRWFDYYEKSSFGVRKIAQKVKMISFLTYFLKKNDLLTKILSKLIYLLY